MRDSGLWHPRLVEIVVSLAHGETLVIGDAGLPVPPGVETIHLGWTRGEPRTTPVLQAVRAELVVESAVLAHETTHPPLVEALADLAVERVSHDELKRRTASARAVVRTGDDILYANVILVAGVPF